MILISLRNVFTNEGGGDITKKYLNTKLNKKYTRNKENGYK